MNIYTKQTSFNSDTMTPVGMFLNLRNHYSKIALLESNDYRNRFESKSFIGFNPIIEIRVQNSELCVFQLNTKIFELSFNPDSDVLAEIQKQVQTIHFENTDSEFNGFFGFVGFEFAHFIEKQVLTRKSNLDVPDFQFYIYEYLIVLDHYKNESFILENKFEDEFGDKVKPLDLLLNKSHTPLYFETLGEETSSLSDEEYLGLVTKAKEHCKRGDVFQLVLSRDFSQSYFGDDFEVYRSLRKLNPSPYLFYFDFETHRILGSSPEAQLKISNNIAEIHPIAGTVKKTGDQETDQKAIDFLELDQKENAEHTMLVDLARNDLSKNCTQVKVEKYKEIQHFSHVIHLVSKVIGIKKEDVSSLGLFASTFPAGTLSGTPKPKALELIAGYEKTTRDYYGGAIGFFGTNGSINSAIVIRSILSKNNTLNYRAGAGIVLHSEEENELQEIKNKLGALRSAISLAQNNKIILKEKV